MIDLLEKMLAFNPENRPKASELLNHKLFAGIRKKNVEQGATHHIQLDIDNEDEGENDLLRI